MPRKRVISQSVVHAMQVRRLCLFTACLLAGFGFLAYRLVDVQIGRHEYFSREARKNTERQFTRKAVRGDIRDVRGNLLATSKVVHNICADPDLIGTNFFTVALHIAPHLEMPVEQLADKLRPRMVPSTNGTMTPLKWVSLKKKVETDQWDKVREAMQSVTFGVDESRMNLTQRAPYDRIRRAGVFSEADELRFYPAGTLASHVLGYVGLTVETNAQGRSIEMRGKDGVEFALDDVLTGVTGWRQTETDIRRRELVLFREQDVAPRHGLNALLTIDAGIQHIVEDVLASAMEKHTPVSITCVVVRPKTGEVLAMANLPTFDPNNLGEGEPAARRNRAITDMAEPGSTFKVVVVSGALSDGIAKLTDMYDCENGRFVFANRSLRDDHPFDVISVEKIIAKSSNIGAAKIGIQLGKNRLYELIRDFGFGQKTGITLPGEADGIFRPPARWSGISITRIPMGHEIACTPLQMAMAMAAVANGGVLMKPMLVDRLVDDAGETVIKYPPREVRRVISPDAAAKMVHALKTAASTNGTASRSQLTYYTVAGKTGTAQKIVNGKYVRNKHYSSFIGFFPADRPELCISVVLDEPKKGYYGGETAAPIFQQIAERAANYLAIPPESMPASTLAASGAISSTATRSTN